MKSLLSWYHPKLPFYLVYMLQQVEYDPMKFMSWLKRLIVSGQSVNTVARRKSLDMTSRAKTLIVAGYLPHAVFVFIVFLALTDNKYALAAIIFGLLVPVITAITLFKAAYLAHVFIVSPKNQKLIQRAQTHLAKHKATKIAVAGSYGKTTTKELLAALLATNFKTAVTEANKNTLLSNAVFINNLAGDEEVLIFELGEGKPGDIKQFCELIKPDYAFLTGIAPNHLDFYKTVDNLANDFLVLRDYVSPKRIFVNQDSSILKPYLKGDETAYSALGLADWTVRDVDLDITGTSFEIKNDTSYRISTPLLGRHMIGVVSACAYLAIELGCEFEAVKQALISVEPYEHRMKPYRLGKAWIIDDTYNGNLEGMQAGLNLLRELKADKKWYVTPGLVDQGEQTESVHRQLAAKIAEIKPDVLVLMDNSATKIIQNELKLLGYEAEVRVQPDPLEFYNHLDHFVTANDLVLLQNDWTDNYH